MASGERRRLRILLPDRPDWMMQGKCLGIDDPSLFYPERSNGEVQKAKAVCKGLDGAAPCPVLDECLSYAISEEEKFGVWGGTSERERRRLKKSQQKKPA